MEGLEQATPESKTPEPVYVMRHTPMAPHIRRFFTWPYSTDHNVLLSLLGYGSQIGIVVLTCVTIFGDMSGATMLGIMLLIGFVYCVLFYWTYLPPSVYGIRRRSID